MSLCASRARVSTLHCRIKIVLSTVKPIFSPNTVRNSTSKEYCYL